MTKNINFNQMYSVEKATAYYNRKQQPLFRHYLLNNVVAKTSYDLKQPLTIMANFVSACRRELRSGSCDPARVEALLMAVNEQILATGESLHRLESLSKNQTLHFETCDLNDLISNLVRYIQTDFYLSEVAFAHHLSVRLPLVKIDRLGIEQIIIALLRVGIDLSDKLPSSRVETILMTRIDQARQIEVLIRHLYHPSEHSSQDRRAAGDDDLVNHHIWDHTWDHARVGNHLAFCQEMIAGHRGKYLFSLDTPGKMEFLFTLPALQPPSRKRAAALKT